MNHETSKIKSKTGTISFGIFLGVMKRRLGNMVETIYVS